VIIYSDGLSEAENADGAFFDNNGLREAIRENAALGCAELHTKLTQAVDHFLEGAEPGDDITLLVLEYRP
jgi:serine phosphatase RsbU (regulator of sigma subunit)